MRNDSTTIIRTLLASASVLPAVTPITAQSLLAYVAGRDRAWLLAHPEDSLSPEQTERFEQFLARAAQGEPLAYLLGEKEFCGLAFMVTPDVLIPRPETETLVEAALDWAAWVGKADPAIVDVGAGSGAIAVTLAVKLPGARVTAVDVSEKALALVRANAERHGVAGRVRLAQGDLLETLPGPFDAIVANLPYIPTPALADLEVSRWEPALALDGGGDGLSLIRRLVEQASTRLAAGGLLALEIQYDQGQRVAELCRTAFPGGLVRVDRDLAGLDRMVVVKNSPGAVGAIE